MKQLKLFDARSAPKRKLTRKRRGYAGRKAVPWAEVATTRDRASILQTMPRSRLISNAYTCRVCFKTSCSGHVKERVGKVAYFSLFEVRPRSAESEFGLKWRGPDQDQLTGRKNMVRNFESGEPKRTPDKYLFAGVRVDSKKHTAHLKKPELVFSGIALGQPSKEVTSMSGRRAIAFDSAGRKIPLPE